MRRTSKCCLCGKIKDLSFEHVPPKNTYKYRDSVFESIDFMDWIQEKGTYKKRKKIRGGLGAFTLCIGCNNLGGRYAREYKEWVNKAINILKGNNNREWSGILTDIYPVRFLKEVALMFCSLNGPQFAEKNPNVRDFIMSKDGSQLPPEITIYMYLNTSKLITRTGITGLIQFEKPSKVYVVSEYNFPPFGFAMYIGNAKYDKLTDITWFDEYGYDEKVDIPFQLPILERNVPFPADYRTSLEIEYDRIKNQVEEFKNLKQLYNY